MPKEQKTVTTEADSILNFVQERGEVSLDEISKEFNMPLKTVESYANFFEEEGLLSLKYKFTTPYLCPKEEKEQLPEIEFSYDEQKKKQEKLLNLIKSIKEELYRIKIGLKSGEYYLMRDKVPKLIDHIKQLMKESSKLKPGRVKQLNTELDRVTREFGYALKELSAKKTKEAKGELEKVEKHLEGILRELTREGVTVSIELGKLASKEELQKIKQEIYAKIRERDYESATELLKMLEAAYQKLPSEFDKQELFLKRELEKLKKDLTQGKAKLAEKDTEKKVAKIKHLLATAKHYFERGKLEEAVRSFNSVKELYLELPKGFVKKRIELSNEILNLYKSINSAREVKLETEFKRIALQLKEELARIKELLHLKQFNEAIASYNRAVELFNKLPKIHAPIRNTFKTYLMIVYEKLSKLKRATLRKTLNKLVAEIDQEISRCRNLVNKGVVLKAKELYEDLLEHYRNIPRSHTEILIPLQQKLFSLYQELASAINMIAEKQLSLGIAKINSHIILIDKLISEQKYEEALAMYQKTMVLYNMLPRGFLKEKLAIRKALMKKEQEVSSFVDKYVITGASEEVRRAYHALMKYIALFNMHLEANSFQLASTTYRRILQLLNKLPYGIITRSKLLMQELKEVAREARILRLFKRIQSSVSQSNRETAKRYVTEARLELSKLDQTQPQVIGLYRYLNHIILKSKQSGTPIFKGIKLPKQATVEQPITRQITKEQLLKEFQNSIKQLEQEKKPKSELQELKPLTKEQEEEVNRIANRELSGELKDEQFNKLNELLQKELTKGIAENKNEKLSNNLKMARMFIELGDKQKAKEFLEKVLAAEPGNKIAEALLNQLKVS